MAGSKEKKGGLTHFFRTLFSHRKNRKLAPTVKEEGKIKAEKGKEETKQASKETKPKNAVSGDKDKKETVAAATQKPDDKKPNSSVGTTPAATTSKLETKETTAKNQE